jgi:hypothetical protein
VRPFVCHDYGHNGRSIAWEPTVSAQKKANILIGDGAIRSDFVKMRKTLDAQLSMPKLIIPLLQVNIRAGEVPRDEAGNMTLKIQVNKL